MSRFAPGAPAVEITAAPAGRRVGARAAQAGLLLAAVGTAMAFLILALQEGGGRPQARLAGLPDSGPVVGWGLPVVRTTADLCLIAAVGAALLAVLLPLRRGRLAAETRTALRAAAAAGACGAAALAVTALLGFVDEVGSSTLALTPAMLRTQLPQDSNAVDLLLSAAILLVGAAVAGWAAAAGGRDSTSWPLLIVFAAVLPIALTGHAATGPRHLLGLASLAVHLLAVCAWVGGLGALAVYARSAGPSLAPVLPRFSAVAAACYLAVGASGAGLAVARLARPAQLVSTDYGRIMTAKIVAYLVIGVLAAGHRRRTLPAVAADLAAAGSPRSTGRRAFARLAGAEVLLMAATVGLAVALSRTPPPA